MLFIQYNLFFVLYLCLSPCRSQDVANVDVPANVTEAMVPTNPPPDNLSLVDVANAAESYETEEAKQEETIAVENSDTGEVITPTDETMAPPITEMPLQDDTTQPLEEVETLETEQEDNIVVENSETGEVLIPTNETMTPPVTEIQEDTTIPPAEIETEPISDEEITMDLQVYNEDEDVEVAFATEDFTLPPDSNEWPDEVEQEEYSPEPIVESISEINGTGDNGNYVVEEEEEEKEDDDEEYEEEEEQDDYDGEEDEEDHPEVELISEGVGIEDEEDFVEEKDESTQTDAKQSKNKDCVKEKVVIITI